MLNSLSSVKKYINFISTIDLIWSKNKAKTLKNVSTSKMLVWTGGTGHISDLL